MELVLAILMYFAGLTGFADQATNDADQAFQHSRTIVIPDTEEGR